MAVPNLPAKYAWLANVNPPNIIKQALALYGTLEKVGPQSNPEIISWAKECGIIYGSDDIPWCGLFAAVVVKRAGWEFVKSPLWARSWVNFGNKSPKAGLGDALVFSRDGGGHVGFYIAEDPEHFHVLGGNQSDSVNIIRIRKDRLLDARRPAWKVKQPDSVKQYFIDATGAVSTNER